ncbi:MAG: hypothetical protein FD146_1804 [Anaerolineaceae bacterium]|nr:MAG: hypothetical protein FD146_1804 [Anaerolineaceae bacterium]
MNTFAIKIAKQAEKVDFENLSPGEQENLFDNRKYDAARDVIYAFKVAIVVSPGKVKKQNVLKRDFKLADTLLVGIRDFTGFTLTGIHPLSEEYQVTRTDEKGLEGEARAGIKLLFVSFKPVGRTKEEIKTGRTSILQSFDEENAQWLFKKLYLENHFDYKFLIAVQKKAEQESASFICEVDVQGKNRSLLPNIAHKRVACVDKL